MLHYLLVQLLSQVRLFAPPWTVLAYNVQKNESVIHIHLSCPFWISLSFKLLQCMTELFNLPPQNEYSSIIFVHSDR